MVDIRQEICCTGVWVFCVHSSYINMNLHVCHIWNWWIISWRWWLDHLWNDKMFILCICLEKSGTYCISCSFSINFPPSVCVCVWVCVYVFVPEILLTQLPVFMSMKNRRCRGTTSSAICVSVAACHPANTHPSTHPSIHEQWLLFNIFHIYFEFMFELLLIGLSIVVWLLATTYLLCMSGWKSKCNHVNTLCVCVV